MAIKIDGELKRIGLAMAGGGFRDEMAVLTRHGAALVRSRLATCAPEV